MPSRAHEDLTRPLQTQPPPGMSLLCPLSSAHCGSFWEALETHAAPVLVSTLHPQWSCSHRSPRVGRLACLQR